MQITFKNRAISSNRVGRQWESLLHRLYGLRNPYVFFIFFASSNASFENFGMSVWKKEVLFYLVQ